MKFNEILYVKGKFLNTGLLLLRLGIGISFIFHGYPKLSATPEILGKLGEVVSTFGIDIGWTYFGLAAGIIEFVGGIFLILGLFFRLTNLAMFVTMAMAVLFHINNGDDFAGYSHALEAGILFFSFMIIGPGKYCIDRKVWKGKRAR